MTLAYWSSKLSDLIQFLSVIFTLLANLNIADLFLPESLEPMIICTSIFSTVVDHVSFQLSLYIKILFEGWPGFGVSRFFIVGQSWVVNANFSSLNLLSINKFRRWHETMHLSYNALLIFYNRCDGQKYHWRRDQQYFSVNTSGCLPELQKFWSKRHYIYSSCLEALEACTRPNLGY